MIVLSPDLFFLLFVGFACGPLVLLVCLLFPRPVAKRLLMASFIFFLPAGLLTALVYFSKWKTEPPTREGGMLYVVVFFVAITVYSLLSLVCGAFCFRRYPWSAVWLVPAAVLLAYVGGPAIYLLWR